jgi:hypothetical protein
VMMRRKVAFALFTRLCPYLLVLLLAVLFPIVLVLCAQSCLFSAPPAAPVVNSPRFVIIVVHGRPREPDARNDLALQFTPIKTTHDARPRTEAATDALAVAFA